MTFDKKLFGRGLKKIRKEKGLTVKALAALSGVSRESIDRFERGTFLPRIDNFARLCDALEIPFSLEYICGKEKNESKCKNDSAVTYTAEELLSLWKKESGVTE